MRSEFPQADVTENRVNKYPIRVVVTARVGKTTVKVWEGDQKSLFRKYGSRRKKAMVEMATNLKKLK